MYFLLWLVVKKDTKQSILYVLTTHGQKYTHSTVSLSNELIKLYMYLCT